MPGDGAHFLPSALLEWAWRHGYALRHIVFAVEPGYDTHFRSLAEILSRFHLRWIELNLVLFVVRRTGYHKFARYQIQIDHPSHKSERRTWDGQHQNVTSNRPASVWQEANTHQGAWGQIGIPPARRQCELNRAGRKLVPHRELPCRSIALDDLSLGFA